MPSMVIIRIMMVSEIHIPVKTYQFYILKYMQFISIYKLNFYKVLKHIISKVKKIFLRKNAFQKDRKSNFTGTTHLRCIYQKIKLTTE